MIPRKLLHALDNHGFLGVLRRLFVRRGSAGPADFAEPEQPHPFDVRHGTDTSGYISGEHLGSGLKADRYNTAYYGISPSSLADALALLPVDPARFTFVDLGCGKGRALLVAAEAQFHAVAGVELSPELAAIAGRNAEGRRHIAVETGDASTLTYPAGPLVVFLYHPFLAPLQRRVFANLERQLRQSPRETYVLSANPGYPRVYAAFPFLEEVWTTSLPLSAEDAAHDRHGTTHERYALWRSNLA